MHYSKLEGIIINRHTVGDADRFYTILTSDAGKISVYARSVRSLKSKRASSLDLFSLIRFETSDNFGRRTLTHVDLVDSFRAGKKELKDISRLFQIGELIDALVPEEDPHEIIFSLLHKALKHLSQFDTPEYMFRFKIRLLRELGFENTALTPEQLDPYIESLMQRSFRAKLMI